MKNLDIENLERKNIYKIPDESFFAEMQAKVLQEITPKKKAKIIKLNWMYAAAAAIAMVFGITFVMNQNETTASQNLMTTKVLNEKVNDVIITESVNKLENETTIAYQTLQEDLTSAEEVHPKIETVVKVANREKVSVADPIQPKTVVQTPEVQVDQILSSFTSAELADLGKNSEQDIYLDLYN